MEFNADGTLKVKREIVKPPENMDHIILLKAIQELPFNVGKKLLINFLQGQTTIKSITQNKLDKLESFGCLAYQEDELEELIDKLSSKRFIESASIKGKSYFKVINITQKGINEINNPVQFQAKKQYESFKTEITEEDRRRFQAFGKVLSKFNDEQKKAIISTTKQTLCIAGAGSGKTTVLTNRIRLLVKYKSVDPKKILAITFTRKARQEMLSRLSKVSYLNDVSVETFNSFSEKILRKFNDIIYGKTVRIISYRDKFLIINKALSSISQTLGSAVRNYFTPTQMRGRTKEQLSNIFMNDCFFVRDYLKFKNRELSEDIFDAIDSNHKKSAKIVYEVCEFIDKYMNQHGLRDFADQLIDTITFFKKHPQHIPNFDHVLIDEYQDINSTQIELIELLCPDFLFAVGDPRQSIYGWRGSDISYILDFKKKYPDSEIVSLTKNYRSTKPIVDLINSSIKNMDLDDLVAMNPDANEILLKKLKSESDEFEFVIREILKSNIQRREIFVLARTNKQLAELSRLMKERDIKHIVRNDEMRKSIIASEGDVTLATIHSIKGLEAEMVFAIGCSSNNFPCKGTEHPIIDMIKVDEYDKEEEERRLFYVAMSRAKKYLYLTYSTAKHTYFITNKMKKMISSSEASFLNNDSSITERLRAWRKIKSDEMGVPAYIIMSNRTLEEIARKQPTGSYELEEVHGFGPIKISKYGEDILDVVNCIK
jgi:superfamily I DNA/RNA helicase